MGLQIMIEYFKELQGYSCIIWTLDNCYISSAYGKTKQEAKKLAIKKANLEEKWLNQL